MAFANLFSGLSPMVEDARSPGVSDITSRTENSSRGKKRKTQSEQHGSYKKKCRRFQTEDNFTSWNKPCQKQATKSQRSSLGQKYNRCFNSSYNGRQSYDGRVYQTKDNSNAKEMHHGKNKKKKKKKNEQPGNRGAKPMLQLEKKPRYMTQEFKDQNAVLVDGRLLCRHFLLGRCIKEDQCQLEHITGNDIIKEACKFYIQGTCMKGDNCPFMHNSFPCKFFHRKARCLQEGNCKFSHDPLNDFTEKLLDEALKKDEYFYELAKNNEEESSEQTPKTEETKPAEENKNADFLTRPHRPCFYNSAEKEPDEHPDVKEQRVLDEDQPGSSQNPREPVPYSVEAVLGPQLSRTLSGFSKTPTSQDYSPVSEPHATSSSTGANQSIAPYAVEAVLRSYRSADDSSKGQTPDPACKRVPFYAPLISEEIEVTSFRKEKPPSMFSIIENGSQHKMPKSLSSVEMKGGIISDRVPVSHTSEDEEKTYWKRESYHPERSASSTSEGANGSLTWRKGRLQPNSSKGRDADPVEPVTTCDEKGDAPDVLFRHSQLSVIPLKSKNTNLNVQTATEEQFYNNSQKSITKAPTLGDFSAGSKMQKRPFRSLFAAPLTDSAAPGSESVAAAVKPQQSEGGRNPCLPFISLFASPPSENPSFFPSSETKTLDLVAPLCKQQSAKVVTLSSKRRASDLRFFPSQVRSSHREPSPESSQRSRTENDLKQSSASVCSTVSDSPCDPSSNQTDQDRPDVSSPRASSVLKSLFVQLKPFQEDREQQGCG